MKQDLASMRLILAAAIASWLLNSSTGVAALGQGLFAASISDIREPPLPKSKQEEQKPALRRIDKNLYRVADITVDTKQRTVTFPAKVNLTQGILEVLICTEYGKTHESLLVTNVDPLHLNVAFLLLGLEGGNAVKYQGDPTKPVGSPVEIWLKVKKGDKEQLIRTEDWVYNTHKNRPMLHTQWIYVGSVLTRDGFMAQREGQIATTFHDPFALIDNPLPGGGDDTVYVVHTKEVPPSGTPVTVVIKAVAPVPKDR
jgi:hypothetical protein